MSRCPALLLGTLVLVSPLGGQSLEPPIHIYVGAGLEIIGTGDGGRFTPGPSFQLGIVRQATGSRLALRAGATYYERDRRYVFDALARESAVGASVELTYDLGRRTSSAYVLGGVGVYRLTAFANAEPGPAPVSQLSGALIAGFGVRRALGPTQVFAEMRYHRFTNGDGFAGHLLPMTLGVRF